MDGVLHITPSTACIIQSAAPFFFYVHDGTMISRPCSMQATLQGTALNNRLSLLVGYYICLDVRSMYQYLPTNVEPLHMYHLYTKHAWFCHTNHKKIATHQTNLMRVYCTHLSTDKKLLPTQALPPPLAERNTHIHTPEMLCDNVTTPQPCMQSCFVQSSACTTYRGS